MRSRKILIRNILIVAITICLVWFSIETVLLHYHARQFKLVDNSFHVGDKRGAKAPRLAMLPDKSVLMSWTEPQDSGHVLKFGVFKNGQWVRHGEVAHGENWFVNWADLASVVAIDEKFWVAHWLVKQQGGKTYDYDIAVAISHDAGLTWSKPKPPHQDGAASEHGFATIFPEGNDAGMIWLDGRDYVKQEDRTKHPEKSGNFNLRYTRIYRDGSFGDEVVIDNNTCTCCWTSVAVTPLGVIAAWRSRTDAEIRDNKVALLRKGVWSAPKPLGAEGWKIAGCPVNGPAIVARDSQVAAAWFTAQGDKPRVRAAFSNDGGQSFGKPIEIDNVSPLGRIGLVWRDDNTAVVSWMTTVDGATKKSSLALRPVHKNGTLGSITKVVEISAGRDAGVPQMAADDKRLMLAWTADAPDYGIKTVEIAWQDIPLTDSTKLQSFAVGKLLPFIPYICGRAH